VAEQLVRPGSAYAKLTARALVRELVWLAACRHRPGSQRNICLFATRRGGSTFAMEIIGANRGIRSMNQPLETLSRNLTLGQALGIPRFPQGQITSLDERNGEILGRFVTALLSGEVVVNAPTKFWKPDFERVSNRIVLKILDAKAVIDWFDEHFDVDIVYFTRHPLAQSLSCIRNRWNVTTKAYLADPVFCERYLGDAFGRCQDLARSGSELERWVLNWAVENVAPLTLLPSHPDWLHLRYEDTVLEPERELHRLADRLGLVDLDRMQATLRRPSVSSGRSRGDTRDAIKRGDRTAAAEGWRSKVDADDVVRTAGILELVGIDPAAVVDRW